MGRRRRLMTLAALAFVLVASAPIAGCRESVDWTAAGTPTSTSGLEPLLSTSIGRLLSIPHVAEMPPLPWRECKLSVSTRHPLTGREVAVAIPVGNLGDEELQKLQEAYEELSANSAVPDSLPDTRLQIVSRQYEITLGYAGDGSEVVTVSVTDGSGGSRAFSAEGKRMADLLAGYRRELGGVGALSAMAP